MRFNKQAKIVPGQGRGQPHWEGVAVSSRLWKAEVEGVSGQGEIHNPIL